MRLVFIVEGFQWFEFQTSCGSALFHNSLFHERRESLEYPLIHDKWKREKVRKTSYEDGEARKMSLRDTVEG